MSSRKLTVEIEKTLKKVTEGVEVFESKILVLIMWFGIVFAVIWYWNSCIGYSTTWCCPRSTFLLLFPSLCRWKELGQLCPELSVFALEQGQIFALAISTNQYSMMALGSNNEKLFILTLILNNYLLNRYIQQNRAGYQPIAKGKVGRGIEKGNQKAPAI